MHRVPSSLVRGVALGAAALSLSSSPSFASSTNGLARPKKPAVSTGASTPGPTAPKPNLTPVIGLFQPVEYAPKLLDLGMLRSYRGEQRTVKLTLTSPTNGDMTARLDPAGPFRVTRLVGDRGPLQRINEARRQIVPGSGTLSVSAGQPIEVEVTLQPTRATNMMPKANLVVTGHNWFVEVPVRALVTHEPEIVATSPSGEYKLAPGGAAETTIRLTRTRYQSLIGPSGADRNVTITGQTLPAGITMEPVTVHIPVDAEFVDATVRFQASAGTPPGWNQATTLLVDSGVDRETLDLNTQVYPSSYSWDYRQQVGDVRHTGTLTIHSDGTWQWKARLYDDGAVYGDYYFVTLWFNVPVSAAETKWLPEAEARQRGWRPGTLAKGSLGGGVFGGSRSRDIDLSSDNDEYNGPGPNRWLREHYIEAFEGGIKIEGTASGDFGPVVEWYVETLWKAVGVPIDL
jgi:hypothetical protein